MRGYEWRAARWSEMGQLGEYTFGVALVNLDPGETLTRSLFWITAEVTTESPDPAAGWGNFSAMGMSIASSNETPDLQPLTNWNYVGSPSWLWRWIPAQQGLGIQDAINPDSYRAKMMDDSRRHETDAQRLNSSDATQYVWLQWEIDPAAQWMDTASFFWSVAGAFLVRTAAS